MVARANKGFPCLSRRSGHCRNVSRTPVNIRADSGLTRSPGESLPESGRHRKDAVYWTAHAVPGVSLPEISRASEWAPSCGRHTRFLKSLCQESADTERTPPSGPHTRSPVTFTWNQQKGRRLLHGCPLANDSFQWLAWRNDHRRRRW